MKVQTCLAGILLLVTVGLTGCLGMGEGDEELDPTVNSTEADPGSPTTTPAAPPANETPPESDAPEPRLETTWFNGSVQSAVIGEMYVCPPPPTACDNTVSYPVEQDALSLVVELAWNSSEPLDLLVVNASDQVVDRATDATSPVRIEITGAALLDETGGWQASAWSHTPAEAVDFTLVATVVYDAQPDGEVGRLVH